MIKFFKHILDYFCKSCSKNDPIQSCHATHTWKRTGSYKGSNGNGMMCREKCSRCGKTRWKKLKYSK